MGAYGAGAYGAGPYGGGASTAYAVINGTGATLVDVNAAGDDVAAFSFKRGLTLTDTELETLAAMRGVFITSDDSFSVTQLASVLPYIVRHRSA